MYKMEIDAPAELQHINLQLSLNEENPADRLYLVPDFDIDAEYDAIRSIN